MAAIYEEEITESLVNEIAPDIDTRAWRHWKLVITVDNLCLLGYDDAGHSSEYDVPQEKIPTLNFDEEMGTVTQYVDAGGSVGEYKKYHLLGNLLFFIPLLISLCVIVAIIVFVNGI